jgi:hypothetical protein
MPSASGYDHLFVETGSMQGEKRYLLEIKEELADFFEEKRNVNTQIHIEFDGRTYWDKKLAARTREHYSPQWRVFLPTEFANFDESFYPYKYVKFDKEQGPQGTQYALSVENQESGRVDNWRENAKGKGVYGKTKDGEEGREYGYY